MSENQPMESREHDRNDPSAQKADDRRQGVRPEESPVPRNPDRDEEAVRKGKRYWSA